MSALNASQCAALRALIVRKAASHVGDQEVPKYSNRGPEVDRFLAYVGVPSGSSWCMAFACFCAGKSAEAMGFDFSALSLIKTGYCPSQVQHARGNGSLVASTDAASGVVPLLPGWLMCEWIPSEGGYHHTGIVAAVTGGGFFLTIEGNTSTEGGNEGYEVAYQHRHISDAASDGHAKYCFVATI